MPASIASVAAATLADGAVAPGLKPGNIVDRLAVVAAIRRAFEDVGARPNSRNADVTLVIPDGACRVLLLDFEALSNKLSEALPLIRFRLKKLVPFDSDSAMVSFQIMSQSRQVVRVLVVAIPRDVLAEYETAVREAGFEPGAVLPSTLAALAGAPEEGASLVVNAAALSITTAIVRDGILLLHRTVDLQADPAGVPANVSPALLEPSGTTEFTTLPLVSREETQAEWAAQEPLPEFGRDPYADRVRAEESVQNFDGVTGLPAPSPGRVSAASSGREPGGLQDSPYAQPEALADLTAEKHHSILYAPTSPGTFEDPRAAHDPLQPPSGVGTPHTAEPLPPDAFAHEVAEAVSVAAAYFEDTLAAMPDAVLASGILQPASLQSMLRSAEIAGMDDVRVREIVPAEAMAADVVSSRVSRTRLGPAWGALCG